MIFKYLTIHCTGKYDQHKIQETQRERQQNSLPYLRKPEPRRHRMDIAQVFSTGCIIQGHQNWGAKGALAPHVFHKIVCFTLLT